MNELEIYKELIIEHGTAPRNFDENLVETEHSAKGVNPLCGDKIFIALTVKDKKITDIKFKGSGCAISIASSSLMTEAIKGKTLEEALHLFENFHKMVTTEEKIEVGKLSAFSGVKAFPSRVKCATLAWHALKSAIQKDQEPASTE